MKMNKSFAIFLSLMVLFFRLQGVTAMEVNQHDPILKTAESVSLGHPDKIADFISCYILDRLLEQDANIKYAVEVMVKDHTVVLAYASSCSTRQKLQPWSVNRYRKRRESIPKNGLSKN